MWKEFKEFISRGSVIDLAVGVIIGAAFSKIINSVVNDIIMPIIGLVLGRINFSGIFIALDGKSYPSVDVAKAAGVGTVNIGIFLNVLIEFLIIAFVLFLLIKAINKMRRQPPPAPAVPPPPTKEETLLTEIRDLLKQPRK